MCDCSLWRHFGQYDIKDASGRPEQGFELSPSESTPFEGEFVYSGRYFGGCSQSKHTLRASVFCVSLRVCVLVCVCVCMCVYGQGVIYLSLFLLPGGPCVRVRVFLTACEGTLRALMNVLSLRIMCAA